MLRTIVLVLLIASTVPGRVTFDKSQVLDNVDLKGINTATFRCSAGCRVYSPTKNQNIVIVDSSGKEDASLKDLSTNTGGLELPPSTGMYLKNKGAADPAFLFYAVERGAANYDAVVVYVDEYTTAAFSAEDNQIVSVLSASGAVAINSFQGDYTDALPIVYTAPFDAIGSCRPVYTGRSSPSVLRTSFPVYSPVATIDFRRTRKDKIVVASGDYKRASTSMMSGASTVLSSLGNTGCASSDLYTLLPDIGAAYDKFTFQSTNLSVTINGYYSIEKEADAVKLRTDDNVEKLYGSTTIANTYDARQRFEITAPWLPSPSTTSEVRTPKDSFALQMDVTSDGPIIAYISRPVPDETTTTTQAPKPTTSTASSFGVLAGLVVALLLAAM